MSGAVLALLMIAIAAAVALGFRSLLRDLPAPADPASAPDETEAYVDWRWQFIESQIEAARQERERQAGIAAERAEDERQIIMNTVD